MNKAMLSGVFALGLCGGAVASDVVAPDAVELTEAGTIEAPLTAEPGDGYRGVQLFITEEAMCTSCHYNHDVEGTGLSGDVGPTLSLIGDQDSVPQLRAILVNAPAVFGEDTPMPAYYVADEAGETILSAQDIEDLIAYLQELQIQAGK
ncbi:MAG: c-type cytochrome [Pikeienuella sp.]